MIFRVIDVLPEIGPSVRGAGVDVSCEPGHGQAIDALNRATRQLMVEGDWVGMEQEICLCINECCITLDEHFEAIRLAAVRFGNPMPIYNSNFKYLETGFGELDCCSSDCLLALEDLGDGFALHRDPYRPMPILAYSDRKECKDACMEIRGTDENGKEILYGLPIRHAWKQSIPPAYTGGDNEGWSTGNWAKVNHIHKEKTNGYVYLWGFDREKGEYCWLSTVRPETTSPCHRRYKVPGGSDHCPQQIIAKVSVRWRPLCRDSDVILIQNPDALARMIKANAALDEREIGQYVALKNTAISQLKKQIKKRDKATKMGINVRTARTPIGGRSYNTRWGTGGRNVWINR